MPIIFTRLQKAFSGNGFRSGIAREGNAKKRVLKLADVIFGFGHLRRRR